jgi:hypothetical protein
MIASVAMLAPGRRPRRALTRAQTQPTLTGLPSLADS